MPKLFSLGKFMTVITDASYCPETKVGGWGIWIGGKQGFSGPIPPGILESSNDAELFAAAAGISLAIEHYGSRNILIQSDCMGVQALVRKPKTRQKWLGDEHLTLRFKHVPGHTERPEARFYCNRWCDQQARRHMRETRDALKEAG